MSKNLLRTALFGLMVALAMIGCKKEESTVSSFEIKGSKSYFFEPDETIKVYYSQKRIAKIDVSSIPEGWDYSVQSGYIAIHAPAHQGEQSGTIEIKAISMADAIIKRTIEVSIVEAYDLSAKGRANCYITPSSGRFVIDGSMVDGIGAIEFSEAKLLWSAPADVVSSVQSRDGKISFSTSGEGNAVVAATDSKGNILWSWHIWVADFDAETSAQPYADGSLVMSRNLGAWADSNDTEQTSWGSCGTYYQWGRKDPFVGSKAYNSTVNQSMYNADGGWVGITTRATSASIGTISFAIQNPTTFICGTEKTAYDWLFAERDNALWSSTTKSAYDPCPAGWRVSPSATLNFATEQTVDGYLRGWEFDINLDTYALYTAAGRRSFIDGAFTNVDATGYLPVGFYWSADTEGSSAKAMEFSPTEIGTSAIYRANACPVRCIKE